MCHLLDERKSKIQSCDVSVSAPAFVFPETEVEEKQLLRDLHAGLEKEGVGMSVKRTIKESIYF